MKYEKPEIRNADSALAVIKGKKDSPTLYEVFPTIQQVTAGAYEADE